MVKRKDSGGLGIRTMHEMNIAFLTKLGWQITREVTSLWSQVLLGKYMDNQRTPERLGVSLADHQSNEMAHPSGWLGKT